jgi:hypothetical protein
MTTVTKRVTTQSASGGSAGSVGTDTWGGTWGGAWGTTWFFDTPPTPPTGEKPEVIATPRISGVPTANVTKRVTL